MSKEFKVIESNIQPNHKEAEIWMTPADNNGSRLIKHYNNVSKEWEGGSGSGSGEEDLIYCKLPESGIAGTGDLICSKYVKIIDENNGIYRIASMIDVLMIGDASNENLKAVAINPNPFIHFKVVNPDSGEIIEITNVDELKQFYSSMGIDYKFAYESWERITKEEFYNLKHDEGNQ